MHRDPLAHVVYRATAGSHAYGLSTPTSDRDARAVYVPPTAWHWSLQKPPEQVESIRDGVDSVTFEVEKFVRLALKGNPTALEILYSPLFEVLGPAGEALRALRPAFLSNAAPAAYHGFAQAQAALVRRKASDGRAWQKPAMHLVRLLHAGAHLCRTGQVMVDVGEHRPELMAIRGGDTTPEAVDARVAELLAALAAARKASVLPADPDAAAVEAFLVETRRQACAE